MSNSGYNSPQDLYKTHELHLAIKSIKRKLVVKYGSGIAKQWKKRTRYPL